MAAPALQALTRLQQAVAAAADADEALRILAREGVALLGASHARLWTLDEPARTLSVRASSDGESAGNEVRVGEGVVGQAARARQPRTEGNERALPLLQGGALLGVIHLVGPGLEPPVPGPSPLLGALLALATTVLRQAGLEAREARARAAAEEAARTKSAFLANMSHELRTPLNAVLGYTEMIRDGLYGDVSGEVTEVLGRIERSGRHLIGLIDDVLDLSRIEAGQFMLAIREYSLKEVVYNVFAALEPLAAEKELRLEVDLPPELPVASGDERRLTQVLLNLGDNAIKFTDQGRVAIAVTVVGADFEVTVSDTGSGVAPEERERIFEVFRQGDNS
ncbi:MAG TPA: histidine kinase dimerization/phospho-acceptor domain-containing protein, partial [Vicinamibacteria bacterium]|nr:histidine kinase dimerization/phospho-acceptor domain-containing protein [Vicinamibacteria bacterium]